MKSLFTHATMDSMGKVLKKFALRTSRFDVRGSIFLLMWICLGCQNPGLESQVNNENAMYTCPMHPQVVENVPGICPICGMDLVRVKNSTNGSAHQLTLSDRQMKLANITTEVVGIKPVGQTAVVNARLAVNERRSEVISSRAAGRIENLYVKETGRTVRRGEPLYVLYSETLLTLQREYLLAKEQYESLGASTPRYASFFNAARKKLLLYGLTKQQIDQLGQSKSLQPRITFLSPASGVVTEVTAAEGQYLPEGGMLYRIEDISKLWVEAELYPEETKYVKAGDKVSIRVAGFESTPIEGDVTFLSPQYRANTQVTIMRAELNNPNLQFKPGMQAQVLFTHSSREALSVPSSAVIREDAGAHVYVEVDENTFEPRRVGLGLEDFGRIEITKGLSEGDTIAATGAYLLYSEMKLKKGSDPMSKMNGM